MKHTIDKRANAFGNHQSAHDNSETKWKENEFTNWNIVPLFTIQQMCILLIKFTTNPRKSSYEGRTSEHFMVNEQLTMEIKTEYT